MKSKIDISYTPSAEEQLIVFQKQQTEKLEDLILESKAYPGLDSIEITGADIQNFAKYFLTRKPYRKKDGTIILFTLYIALGIVITFIGFFYEALIKIIQNNPVQLTYIAAGISLILIGMIMVIYSRRKKEHYNIRKIEESEIFEKYLEQISKQQYEYEQRIEEYNRIINEMRDKINVKSYK